MFAELAQIVGAVLGVHEIAPTDRFAEDLEAESMDIVNIVAAAEERFDVTLDEARLADVRTVGDLHEAVREAVAPR